MSDLAFFEDKKNLSDSEVFAIIEQEEALAELKEFMDDELFDAMIFYLMKTYQKPEIPAALASKVVNRLQALSGLLALKRNYYKNHVSKGAEQRKKKDNLYTAVETIDKLVNALKYSIKDSSA